MSNLDRVREFYSYLLNEVEEAGYNCQEISLLRDMKLYYGRYLNPDSRNYFIQTVVPHLAHAISYFSRKPQCIIDLGCGLGMQSIIFASLGAKVVAVDISERAISLCKKRQVYYEKKLKKQLDVEFILCDFRRCQRKDFNVKFDCLFSMSSFSYISPLDRTVQLISSILKNEAKVFLYEINSNHPVNALRENKIPSPGKVMNAFGKQGFEKKFLYGACSLPKFLWKIPFFNGPLLNPLNNLLRKSLYLSFNYVLGMERRTAI